VSEAEYKAAFPDKPLGDFVVGNWRKPIVSEALAVHPSQVQEVTEFCRARGDTTEFQPDGRPLITSTAHKRKHTKTRGYTCRDHYY
jgi:hypothetical protein